MSLLNTQAAHREYTTRPADERFPSLNALITSALADKNHSVERTYNLKDLQVVPTAGDAGATIHAGGTDASTSPMSV